MIRLRGSALVAVVVVLAITQIIVEDVILFVGATGGIAPGVLDSPAVLVGLPFVLFLLLAGVVWAWALADGDPRF